MKKKYVVLWIDDEHEKMNGFKLQAAQQNIVLQGYKSFNGGIKELKKNYTLYDAILLDAKFFADEDDSSGSEDLSNLGLAKDELLQLPKKFDYFILTGQAVLFEDETFSKFFPKYFKKGNPDDVNKLFNEIKLAGDNQKDTQLRHKHKSTFDACNEKYLGEHTAKDLLFLLDEKNLENGDKLFSCIRKILEDIFIAFNKFNLLPVEFIRPSVALNESSKFLSGFTEKGFTLAKESRLPKITSDNLKELLEITQPGSHRSHVDDHVAVVNNPYLFQSKLFQLLDLITWFKNYIDSNPIQNNWSKNKEEADENNPILVEGEVINFNFHKGFAFLEPYDGSSNIFIPPHLVERYELKDGINIAVEVEEYMDNRTNQVKTRAKNIKL